MKPSHNTHDEFLKLLLRHESVIRACIRTVVYRSEDIDEIMQAVSIVAWRKYEELDEPEAFAQWACMIARYEILKFQSVKARDRHIFDEALLEQIMSEGAEESSHRTRRLASLEKCLERLPEARRALVLQAYAPGCSMKELAKRLNRTEDSLYQLLRRIRLELKACVESRIATEGAS
jgi:RNA polymerase sigma-70 factor (ECF subfamily)